MPGFPSLGAEAARMAELAAESATSLDTKAEMWARQASWLADYGGYRLALEPARKAVTLARWLAGQGGAGEQYRLVTCLNVYGQVLAAAGDHQPLFFCEALDCLAGLDPRELEPGRYTDSGSAANDPAAMVAEMRAALVRSLARTPADPVSAVDDAHEELLRRTGEADLRALAEAHAAYAVRLAALDQLGEAIEHLEQAVVLYEPLAAASTADQARLAAILNRLAAYANQESLHATALAAAHRSADLLRPLAALLPAEHSAELADVLTELALALDADPARTPETRQQAADATAEAVAAFQAAPGLKPGEYEELTIALISLGYECFAAERLPEAAGHLEEAVRQCRRLCALLPNRHEDLLAWAMASAAMVYVWIPATLGDAEGVAADAERVWEAFRVRYPDRCSPELGSRVRQALDRARDMLATVTGLYG
ncbi:hypothetical protein [Longispora albida]|uniref:hypothetical protein n=1 Tax=Longispora albida TaxID=203523 RepID=UPI00036FAD6C|nr:hypothetical protein [Longispora albida]